MLNVVSPVEKLVGQFALAHEDSLETHKLSADVENVNLTMNAHPSKFVRTTTVSTLVTRLAELGLNVMFETMLLYAVVHPVTLENPPLTVEDGIQMNCVNQVLAEGILIAGWKATGQFAPANQPLSEILLMDVGTSVKATTIVHQANLARTSNARTHVSMLAELMPVARSSIIVLFVLVPKIILEIHTSDASQNVLLMLIVLRTVLALA